MRGVISQGLELGLELELQAKLIRTEQDITQPTHICQVLSN